MSWKRASGGPVCAKSTVAAAAPKRGPRVVRFHGCDPALLGR
jgi:hypothetical protein